MTSSDPKPEIEAPLCRAAALPDFLGSPVAEIPETVTGKVQSAEADFRGSVFMKEHGHGRFYDFIWLVYSVFFIFDPIQQHSTKVWVEFAIAYGIFLAIYCGLVFSRSHRTQYWLLVGMGLLAMAYYPFNGGSCGMFIYVAAFVPFIAESILVSVGTLIAATLTMAGEGYYLHISPWSWGICSFFAVAVGAGNLLAAQRMRANKKLGLAHEQIAHLAKLAERERIARDLHDVLGHTLSVVVLKSELAGKLMQRDPERARHEIGEVEQIARKALSEVREAIRGYRSEGLAAEIARAKKTLDAAGVTLECGVKPPQLAPAEETVLSLIVREAVTNIVRHAQASHCRLEFASNGFGTALTVEDDGRGGVREEGNGLRGMRERVESLGGKLRIDSGQGTRLLVEIPPQTVEPS
ncbi:MAG TPA: sensor histidine kinase [Acidobacteriaceae bacterium]|nr:sensor histidine kinase [Acidobacteriaceae bacterium]